MGFEDGWVVGSCVVKISMWVSIEDGYVRWNKQDEQDRYVEISGYKTDKKKGIIAGLLFDKFCSKTLFRQVLNEHKWSCLFDVWKRCWSKPICICV